ncbi:hypothetical protein [Cellulosilyticum ruminicola]|uniref:hypothetical protein n=1 Tax=Cellulosilyticum ruminicola TaxID=425254 RepID=UPI0006D1C55A|nr:hypothetical protein [Cellulosilyticum ruminicola]
MRVKDSNNVWSLWTSRKLTITKARLIKITSLKTSKTSYAKGEKIDFVYTLDNPNDLEVKGQRWRYKNLTTNGSLISGKPKYFKRSGKYEISVELQDERGNWSNKATCIVVIGQNQKIRNGYYLFNEGKQGDLIDGYIDKDYNNFVDLSSMVNVEVLDVNGSLIMSNSPESIPSSGILYRDTLEQEGKILIHHTNATTQNKKLMIIATTKEEEPIKLIVSNEAIIGPSPHILSSGQLAVSTYFKGKKSKEYIVKKGEQICIYNSSLNGVWKPNETITGLLDLYSEGKVSLSVVAMDYASEIGNIAKLAVMPADGIHIRGTFDVIKREYVVDINALTQSAKLVIGRESEEWLKGKDALTGQEVRNKGNYGLPISIKVKSDKNIGIILNARGGSYLGALKWNNNKVFNVPGEDILNNQKVAALVGMTKGNTNSEILYMLPNGSSAPVLFGFIPEAVWKN